MHKICNKKSNKTDDLWVEIRQRRSNYHRVSLAVPVTEAQRKDQIQD